MRNLKIPLMLVMFFCITGNIKSQDATVFKYTPFGKYKIKGFDLLNARLNRSNIIGIDRKGTKRIEGKLSPDGPPYQGKVIRYFANGKIKSIVFYGEKGLNEYYDKKGNLIKKGPNY